MVRNRLRKTRLQTGFRLQELVQYAGVSIATLTAIELYGHVPRTEIRQRLAQALNVTEEFIWPNLPTEEGRDA